MNALAPVPETRFDRRAWLALAGHALLLAAGLAVFLLRYATPTDGWWSAALEGTDRYVFVYFTNLAGAPSGLQAGDRLVAIEDMPLGERTSTPPIAPFWQAGRTLKYTVERAGAPVTVDVPLLYWTPGALWQIARTQPDQAASFVGNVLFLAVALFAFAKRPHNKAAGALLALGVFMNVSSLVTSFLPRSVADESELPASIAGFIAIISLYTVVGPPALLRFALVFPRPKPAVLRRPWLEYAPYIVGVLMLPAFVLTEGGAGWLWTAGSVAGAAGLMIHSAFTMRDSVSQAQLRWAVGGMVVGLGMVLLGYLSTFGWAQGWVASLCLIVAGLSSVVMGLSLGVAVLRYRLFDIDLIIRRTLIYAVLTAALALVYFGSVVVLQTAFRAFTGGAAQSQLAIVASTLTIAALFSPLRRRVQNFIDRRFFRRKYDAAQTLAQFAATARDETNLDQLVGRLVGVVDDTMQPAHASLWLAARPAAGNERKA